jgi:hypothetical protein
MMSLVSKPEEDDASQLVSALHGLEQFAQAFRAAVELFNFSSLQIRRSRDEWNEALSTSGVDPYPLWKQRSTTFVRWQNMAARDGALQIYHMGAVMESIKGQLKNVPTILPFVDSQKLRNVSRLFRSYFPNYKLIRDAVGHSHYEIAPNAKGFQSHAPDEIDIPGLAKGQGIFVTDCLYGNKYIVTKDKKVASYEISQPTYAKLESVRAHFIAGFDKARAEVVKDWPKPPPGWS